MSEFPARELYRGDTPWWSMRITDETMGPMDLAGCVVLITVKSEAPQDSTVDLDDASAIIAHGIEIAADGTVTASNGITLGGKVDGVTVAGADSGVITHAIPRDLSNGLPVGSFVWDLQVTDAAGRTATSITGAPWTVKADVGRRYSVGGGA